LTFFEEELCADLVKIGNAKNKPLFAPELVAKGMTRSYLRWEQAQWTYLKNVKPHYGINDCDVTHDFNWFRTNGTNQSVIDQSLRLRSGNR
jgi:hypothetical protein